MIANSYGITYTASIHFPLAREDTMGSITGRTLLLLQSTSLLRGKTLSLHLQRCLPACFNPLPSCEGRQMKRGKLSGNGMLQSTSLLRGKTTFRGSPFVKRGLQSTSLLRGKTSAYGADAECLECFNPLPSCEGRRLLSSTWRYAESLQSTSLLRGKTGRTQSM